MKRYFEQLTPHERRIVVGVGLLVFLVLNYFFVWGRFGERGREVARLNIAEAKMKNWQNEIKNQPTYLRKIQQLEANGNQAPMEDMGVDLVRFINEKALENQVKLPQTGRPVARTNSPYLMEREVGMQVQASETHLVDFLYSLGSGSSAVRVKSMVLRPDPTHAELNANLSIVASYQTKPPTKSRTPTPATPPDKTAPRPPGPVTAATTNKAGKIAITTTNKPGIIDRIGGFFGRSTGASGSPTNKPAPAGVSTNKATLNR